MKYSVICETMLYCIICLSYSSPLYCIYCIILYYIYYIILFYIISYHIISYYIYMRIQEVGYILFFPVGKSRLRSQWIWCPMNLRHRHGALVTAPRKTHNTWVTVPEFQQMLKQVGSDFLRYKRWIDIEDKLLFFPYPSVPPQCLAECHIGHLLHGLVKLAKTCNIPFWCDKICIVDTSSPRALDAIDLEDIVFFVLPDGGWDIAACGLWRPCGRRVLNMKQAAAAPNYEPWQWNPEDQQLEVSGLPPILQDHWLTIVRVLLGGLLVFIQDCYDPWWKSRKKTASRNWRLVFLTTAQ